MIRYKIDILSALRDKGYTPIVVRRQKLFGELTMTDFRRGIVKFNTTTIDTLCRLLGVQPGDIIEYVPDEPEQEPETASAQQEEPTAEDIF